MERYLTLSDGGRKELKLGCLNREKMFTCISLGSVTMTLKIRLKGLH